jgi:hypothetical protein
MLFVDVLLFLNLLCAGILAGIEIAIHYALHSASEQLAERPQIQLRQALILRLRWLVPAFFLPTTITAVAVIILKHSSTVIILHLLGIACIVIWILVRIIATVRINAATLEWNINAPPTNWKAKITHAERFHIIGTWAAIMIFVLFLAAAVAQK